MKSRTDTALPELLPTEALLTAQDANTTGARYGAVRHDRRAIRRRPSDRASVQRGTARIRVGSERQRWMHPHGTGCSANLLEINHPPRVNTISPLVCIQYKIILPPPPSLRSGVARLTSKHRPPRHPSDPPRLTAARWWGRVARPAGRRLRRSAIAPPSQLQLAMARLWPALLPAGGLPAGCLPRPDSPGSCRARLSRGGPGPGRPLSANPGSPSPPGPCWCPRGPPSPEPLSGPSRLCHGPARATRAHSLGSLAWPCPASACLPTIRLVVLAQLLPSPTPLLCWGPPPREACCSPATSPHGAPRRDLPRPGLASCDCAGLLT